MRTIWHINKDFIFIFSDRMCKSLVDVCGRAEPRRTERILKSSACTSGISRLLYISMGNIQYLQTSPKVLISIWLTSPSVGRWWAMSRRCLLASWMLLPSEEEFQRKSMKERMRHNDFLSEHFTAF